MEALMSWIRSIVILYVVGQVIVYLAQGKKYEKYIRFYLQLLLVLMIARPVFSLLGDEEEFKSRISYHQLSQVLQEQSSQLEQLQVGSDAMYIRECERVVEEDVCRFMEENYQKCEESEVTLSDEFQIEQIKVSVEQGADVRKIAEGLCEHYELSQNQVEVKRL